MLKKQIQRPIEWMGDSLEQLKAMPKQVKKDIGDALYSVQEGLTPRSATPLKYIGSGILEIKENYDKDTYRAIYAVKISESIYVLHVFKKKSKTGIGMSHKDVHLIKKRYKEAVELEKDIRR